MELTLPHLSEHDNAYVRSACGLAFAEAVEMHPELIEESIVGLEELYVERVSLFSADAPTYRISDRRLCRFPGQGPRA